MMLLDEYKSETQYLLYLIEYIIRKFVIIC